MPKLFRNKKNNKQKEMQELKYIEIQLKTQHIYTKKKKKKLNKLTKKKLLMTKQKKLKDNFQITHLLRTHQQEINHQRRRKY